MNLIKYKNRKLYCKDTAKYVNLSEVLNHINKGGSVKVISNRTKRDITNEILKTLVQRVDIDSTTVINLIRSGEQNDTGGR